MGMPVHPSAFPPRLRGRPAGARSDVRFHDHAPMNPAETIVAISSAAGASARMIVRLAGPEAFALARTLTADALPASTATRTRIGVRDLLIPVTLYAFRAPRSYT